MVFRPAIFDSDVAAFEIIVDRLEGADDLEIFSLDETIESQFVEKRLDRWRLPWAGLQTRDGMCGRPAARAPRAATLLPRQAA